jgi:hypothetical protein
LEGGASFKTDSTTLHTVKEGKSMPVLRLSAEQYAAADQSATAALAVGVADDVGDMQNNTTNTTVSGPGGFDETGETPSLSPAQD